MNAPRSTLYMLSSETLASAGAFRDDAERRNLERGCTCAAPEFRAEWLAPTLVVTVVKHDPICPRWAARPTLNRAGRRSAARRREAGK